MDNATAKNLRELIELVPVPGRENVYAMRFNIPPGAGGGEMTEQDWDKFEKDIADACEQIP